MVYQAHESHLFDSRDSDLIASGVSYDSSYDSQLSSFDSDTADLRAKSTFEVSNCSRVVSEEPCSSQEYDEVSSMPDDMDSRCSVESSRHSDEGEEDDDDDEGHDGDEEEKKEEKEATTVIVLQHAIARTEAEPYEGAGALLARRSSRFSPHFMKNKALKKLESWHRPSKVKPLILTPLLQMPEDASCNDRDSREDELIRRSPKRQVSSKKTTNVPHVSSLRYREESKQNTEGSLDPDASASMKAVNRSNTRSVDKTKSSKAEDDLNSDSKRNEGKLSQLASPDSGEASSIDDELESLDTEGSSTIGTSTCTNSTSTLASSIEEKSTMTMDSSTNDDLSDVQSTISSGSVRSRLSIRSLTRTINVFKRRKSFKSIGDDVGSLQSGKTTLESNPQDSKSEKSNQGWFRRRRGKATEKKRSFSLKSMVSLSLAKQRHVKLIDEHVSHKTLCFFLH